MVRGTGPSPLEKEPKYIQSREILQDIQKRKLKKLIGTVETESSMSVEDLESKLKELQRLAEERADLKPCTILVYYIKRVGCD